MTTSTRRATTAAGDRVIGFDIPWWAWAVLAMLCLPGSLLAGFTAMATASATGTHYHSLSKRQVAMGKAAFYGLSLAALGAAALGVFSALQALFELVG